ncbi:hypothetical protein PIB30_012220 [Stylosanthes scabra]|uniref:Ribonuclease H1 N-terminal domain-containing protein n=1 Tax=Stylosanthes scabra TaxID=79078 RepID=A0ABU6V8K0_9FABA|nr:hypothetical protein [Stylosanthes scabra]
MAAKAAIKEALMDREQELAAIDTKIIEEMKQLQEKQRQLQIAEERKKQIMEELKIVKHTLAIKEQTQAKQEAQQLASTPVSTQQSTNIKKPYWVILNSPRKGIYHDWAKVQPLVTGQPYGHKKYDSLLEAKEALKNASQAVTMAQHLQTLNSEPSNRVPLKRTETQIQKLPQMAHLTITKIPTLTQINATTKIQKGTYHDLWNSLMNYKDTNQIHSYYPTYRNHIGPKANILPEATEITTAKYFYSGLTDCIYIKPQSQYQQLSHFPHNIQNAIKQFFDKRAKTRTIFMKVFSSLPFYSLGGDLIEESRQIIILGISNGNFPPRHETPEAHEELTEELYKLQFINNYIGLVEQTQKIKLESKLNYKSKTMIIISQYGQKMTETEDQLISEFERPIIDLQLDITQELKEAICPIIKDIGLHKCTNCQEKKSEEEEIEAIIE